METNQDETAPKRIVGYLTRLKIAWAKTAAWNKVMVILTGILAASSCLYTYYARQQFGIMNAQLTEIRNSGTDTHTLAQAALDSARTAKDTLREIRNEERPWMVVKDAKVTTLEAARQAQIDIVFSNFCHSPALDAKFIASFFVSSDPKADLPPPAKMDEEANRGLVAPSMEMHLRVHTLQTLTAEEVERAKQADVRYYFYGNGSYRDTTTNREIHHTQFCMFLTYGVAGVTPCVGKKYSNTAD